MPYFILIYIFLFGLAIGSFLNCLIWRLHKKEKLWNRSYCPKCKKQITWYDNIPILSFIFLRGKCRHCKKAISWQYPLVEIVTAMLFVVSVICKPEYLGLVIWNNYEYIWGIKSLFAHYQLLITILRDWFIIAVMVIIFVYDLRWYLILDKVTIPACVVIFILNIILGFSWQNLLVSGIIGAGFFLLQFVISKGRWIGGGDIRLGLLMGFTLGYPVILLAMILAYFIGSIISIGLVASGKKSWDSQVPFGVFLTVSTIATLFFGQEIMSWYLRLF